MKKIIYGIVMGIMMVFGLSFVSAESFVEGSFISGEYVSKVKNGVTHYLTMQFIKDSKGNVVYCMEPYVTFQNGSNYKEYEWDLSSYNKLTESKRRKIELLAYYGYGYEGRTDNKWYVITQVLIWKTIDGENNVYFTDKLNGSKITILADVDLHDNLNRIVKSIDLTMVTNVTINGLNENFEIVSSPYNGYFKNNAYYIPNVSESGVIVYKRKSNYYGKNIALFVSDENQDLIRPGNVSNFDRTFTITMKTGNITLDIRDDDSVYSVEKDFSDTCYEIIDKFDNVVDTVCTGKDPLVFQTKDLPYGTYTVKQVKHGLGYVGDSETYTITIDAKNSTPVLILYNKLLRNTISLTKYACLKEDCVYEENAQFRVLDKYENVVDTLTTDEKGCASILLGYGEYSVEQISGLEGYTMSDSFTKKIVDEDSEISEVLYNYAIINEPEVLGEELPPDTGIGNWFMEIINTIRKLIKTILKFG